mmetsp:Transcript_7226/g.13112  ORF Transcript_7226/g.13112 Transcript_7226/m.13112 type:complete len:163 (-) Transcript_7226:358-846(-)|eukprot:CAMPEP_0177753864 /NCGR_PEP_ID=MMETSP0491_2-20121128/1696_1 /TAXON_ID=63592 /ORGANISM="Tetraselmis chuii, Strain PLY429" /LENGTH=162 /DNA_ID=CAMNT_0019269195 /DNA_START=218 /DNA_END=706 /DNA_ORIENTATION=-
MVDFESVGVAVNALSCALCAGAMGGVANFLIAPLFGIMHITTACGVDIAPPLLKEDLYAKVFWGGVWGLVFLEPCLRRVLPQAWARALIYGILPSLVQIFLVFPLTTGFGIGGVGLGAATPVFVLIFNTLGWSMPALGWLLMTGVETPSSEDEITWTNPLLG